MEGLCSAGVVLGGDGDDANGAVREPGGPTADIVEGRPGAG